MNDAQLKAVQQILAMRVTQLNRFERAALALEIVEAVENKATPPPKIASAVTAIEP